MEPPNHGDASGDDADDDGMWTRRYDFEGVKLKARMCAAVVKPPALTRELTSDGLTPLQVEEAFGEGLGGTVWAGSVLLARFLRRAATLRERVRHRCRWVLGQLLRCLRVRSSMPTAL